jgi:uncharacterized membrane protein SpoIIM required for sporulation
MVDNNGTISLIFLIFFLLSFDYYYLAKLPKNDVYPLSAPDAMPAIIFFCSKILMINIGAILITIAGNAISH